MKLFIEGKLYNAVVNAASPKPMAPDPIIDDARKLGFGADPLAGTTLSPRAVVATAILRGTTLPREAAVETSIELGLWPAGTKAPERGMKPRYVEFRAKFGEPLPAHR